MTRLNCCPWQCAQDFMAGELGLAGRMIGVFCLFPSVDFLFPFHVARIKFLFSTFICYGQCFLSCGRPNHKPSTILPETDDVNCSKMGYKFIVGFTTFFQYCGSGVGWNPARCCEPTGTLNQSLLLSMSHVTFGATPMTDSWYRYRHRSELAVKKNPWYREVDSVKVSAEGEREWNELGSKDTAIGSWGAVILSTHWVIQDELLGVPSSWDAHHPFPFSSLEMSMSICCTWVSCK